LEKLEEHIGAPVFVYKHNKLALTRTGERVSHYLCQLFGPDGLGKSVKRKSQAYHRDHRASAEATSSTAI
jgi:hypothetical protein